MKIDYTYIRDNALRWGTYEGSEAHAVYTAASELDASRLASGEYIVLAEETDAHYIVTAEELAQLGAALLAGRRPEETYSIWCASSGREATDDEIDECGGRK